MAYFLKGCLVVSYLPNQCRAIVSFLHQISFRGPRTKSLQGWGHTTPNYIQNRSTKYPSPLQFISNNSQPARFAAFLPTLLPLFSHANALPAIAKAAEVLFLSLNSKINHYCFVWHSTGYLLPATPVQETPGHHSRGIRPKRWPKPSLTDASHFLQIFLLISAYTSVFSSAMQALHLLCCFRVRFDGALCTHSEYAAFALSFGYICHISNAS